MNTISGAGSIGMKKYKTNFLDKNLNNKNSNSIKRLIDLRLYFKVIMNKF